MSKGDTPNHSQEPLCLSCRWATVIRGFATSEMIVNCRHIDHLIPFPVYDCTVYRHKLDPDMHDLERMAYLMERKGNEIGFIKPKRRSDPLYD